MPASQDTPSLLPNDWDGEKKCLAGCAVQAADLRQQALHAVQRDRRVQAHLGRDISLGPGGYVAGVIPNVA